MKRRKYAICLAAVLLFACMSLMTTIAQEEEIIFVEMMEDADTAALVFQAHLYNQQRYTPQSEIITEIRLTNTGTAPLTITLNPNLIKHISYLVTNQDGIVPPPATATLATFDQSAKIPARIAELTEEERKVTLSKGEALLFRDVISDRYSFAHGSYQLTTSMTLSEPNIRLDAPSLRFTVFPAPTVRRTPKTTAMMAEETLMTDDMELTNAGQEERAPLRAAPPDAVVRQMLTTLQEERWEELYGYLDLISLYREEPGRNSLYVNGNITTQQQLIDQFRELIQTQNSPLFRIPNTYRIVHTEYNDVLALVRAEITILLTGQQGITESYELTYRMRRGQREWMIYSISATKSR